MSIDSDSSLLFGLPLTWPQVHKRAVAIGIANDNKKKKCYRAFIYGYDLDQISDMLLQGKDYETVKYGHLGVSITKPYPWSDTYAKYQFFIYFVCPPRSLDKIMKHFASSQGIAELKLFQEAMRLFDETATDVYPTFHSVMNE